MGTFWLIPTYVQRFSHAWTALKSGRSHHIESAPSPCNYVIWKVQKAKTEKDIKILLLPYFIDEKIQPSGVPMLQNAEEQEW